MMGDVRYVHEGDMHSFGSPAKRAREWSKEGALGKYLRSLDAVKVVNRNLFMHGGLHPNYISKDLNERVRALLAHDRIPFDNLLIDPDSPMWYLYN